MQTTFGKGKSPINSKKAVKSKRNRRKEEILHTSAMPEQEQGLSIFIISHI